nr:MAG TPA: hypothetical protein [Caudoviricetes sp.]
MEQEDFWGSYEQFLDSRGFIDIGLPGNHVPDCFYLAYGPAARGVRHAVVCRAGELAHDPHPSRAGLLEVHEIHLIVPKEIS